jgi:hypothetical protein
MRPRIVLLRTPVGSFRRIFQKPSYPELVDRVLVVRAGTPYSRVHVCNCRRSHNNLAPWYDPISDMHVNLVGHPDEIEVHPEAQCLGINGLKKGQAQQLVNIKPNSAFCALQDACINLGPHVGEQLRVFVYLEYGP